jgi:hypothetical protein
MEILYKNFQNTPPQLRQTYCIRHGGTNIVTAAINTARVRTALSIEATMRVSVDSQLGHLEAISPPYSGMPYTAFANTVIGGQLHGLARVAACRLCFKHLIIVTIRWGLAASYA